MTRTSLVARLSESTLFRYLLVGGVGFAFELLVLFIALNFFGSSTTVAVTLSFWLGLVFSFMFQKLFAFGNRDRRPITLGFQGMAYAVLVLVNYAFTVGFSALAAPIIGVYFARAVSLLITTGWNFFVYKKVIFKERVPADDMTENATPGRAAAALSIASLTTASLVLATALVVPLVLLASFANLVADDYSYFSHIDAAGSPLGYAWEHYLTHNGRFSQALFVAVSYTVFGVHAVKIIPVLLLAMIVLLLAWVVTRLVPFKTRSWQSALAIAATVVSIALYSMPSFFDTYLWLTSSTVYLGSISALLLNLCLTLVIIQSGAPRPFLLTVTLILMAAGQTFSEPTALFAISGWGVWGLWALCARNWRSLRIAVLMESALIAGFLANYLSPGTRSRSTEVGADLDFQGAAVGSFGNYSELLQAATPWALLSLLLASALAALNIDLSGADRYVRWAPASVLVLVFLGTTYLVFLVSGVGSAYYPLRNFTLPVFGATASIAGLMIIFWVSVFDLMKSRHTNVFAAVAFLGCAALIFPFAAQDIGLQAQGLAVRDSAITQRSISIADQLGREESGAVLVGAAPVLTRSEAYDIQNPGTQQAEWVIEPFRLRAGIAPNQEIEIVATPPTYCLPASPAVKAEFYCR